ncbi:MAG: ABC-type lipoprotein export system ATPase subunit [Chlamydiales bacterium]|jgi:ABC-type lipoprotein export system ATPase subunit
MDREECEYTKAQFWKCALQVNPFDYISFRGSDHGMKEGEYNQELLRVAKENDIKVIGIADHGNVDGVDAIRSLMRANEIIVFPGFEIASTEKIHFVCLFPENITKDELNRYLGALGLTDPSEGTWPSNLGGIDLLKKVEELGGFVYAAHCTGASGILKQKSHHVWSSPLLKAAQIPGALDGLNNERSSQYYQILKNKTPDYKREETIALINAKDVAKPEDLVIENASCLIKMTRPCFQSFKLAFQDPESRIRLNSDVSEKYYSRIESLKITGGYLNEAAISFSEHLNAVIGGRGTGKSTLLESIRFALELQAIGKSAQKQHEDIIRENLGKERARVELVVRSSKMNGKCFTIARRYGESASVKDEDGQLSNFTPSDILPRLEIYGQNEIYEIAHQKDLQRKLLARFLECDQNDGEKKIQKALEELTENRKRLLEAESKVSLIEDEVARLPKLKEELRQFENLGLEEKLKIIPLLEKEKQLLKRTIEDEEQSLNRAFQLIKESLPDTVFLSETAIADLPHIENFRNLRLELDKMRSKAEGLLSQWESDYTAIKGNMDRLRKACLLGIEKEETDLEKCFKDLPSYEGKSGRQIGVEFQKLMKEIERIQPKKQIIDHQKRTVEALRLERKSILDELSALRAERSAQFSTSLKKLNKRLKRKLKLNAKAESDCSPVLDFLVDCELENVGKGRLSWIREIEEFSPVRLAELIRQGDEALRKNGWNISPIVANALVKLKEEQVLKLEEIEQPDVIAIELNVAHEGEDDFRPMDKLSGGQKCTAILHLLLLQNLDPLIMDQPEDNLDNAFIADRIVAELRSAKLDRQFIFATHNANIPVFGDAEWIGVFEVFDGSGCVPEESQGAIDVDKVKVKAANILEGGKTAFNQRKVKYGF